MNYSRSRQKEWKQWCVCTRIGGEKKFQGIINAICELVIEINISQFPNLSILIFPFSTALSEEKKSWYVYMNCHMYSIPN